MDNGLNTRRTPSSKTQEREDTKRVNNRRTSSSRDRRSGNNRSSNRTSRRTGTISTPKPPSKEELMKNAPNEFYTQNYKIAENPNPFLRDSLSSGTKYNNYQRQMANPNYNEYINKQNKKYGNANLKLSQAKDQPMLNGIYSNPQVVNNHWQTGGLLGSFVNGFWDNLPSQSNPMSKAKSALGISSNDNKYNFMVDNDPDQSFQNFWQQQPMYQFVDSGLAESLAQRAIFG